MGQPDQWTADRIITALVGRYWFNNTVMIEWVVDRGVADFVVISKARYLTEIEIKVSAGDWKKDATKMKWDSPRPHVSRFFYCVPRDLVASAPALPEGVGILEVIGYRWRDGVGVVKKAKRLKGAKKISDETIRAIYKASYFRFWRRTLNVAWKERKNGSV